MYLGFFLGFLSLVSQHGLGKIRINGGFLKGRWVSFSEKAVRPTKATVRKTLFNWLRPVIRGMDCLDCFCGSGVLGFEALSEGAGSVLSLDASWRVVADIRKNIEDLRVGEIEASLWRFPGGLNKKDKFFDLVFLDPPFGKISIESGLQWLRSQRCLKRGALVYIECEKKTPLDRSGKFAIYREAISAGVSFCLLSYLGEGV